MHKNAYAMVKRKIHFFDELNQSPYFICSDGNGSGDRSKHAHAPIIDDVFCVSVSTNGKILNETQKQNLIMKTTSIATTKYVNAKKALTNILKM